jgi:hypothetical protein
VVLSPPDLPFSRGGVGKGKREGNEGGEYFNIAAKITCICKHYVI